MNQALKFDGLALFGNPKMIDGFDFANGSHKNKKKSQVFRC